MLSFFISSSKTPLTVVIPIPEPIPSEEDNKRILAIVLVLISILILLLFNLKSLPWVGLVVAISWAFYNLIRKKI